MTPGRHHYHPSAVVVVSGVTLYVAVGIAAGALASRLAYKHTRSSNAAGDANMWGWWTTFCWPIIGVAWMLFGLGYGVYRILNRIIIPVEARR